MIIRIASTRPPKVNGVRRAVELLSVKFGIPFTGIVFESEESGSTVADTPMSIGELMQGAEFRAKNIFHKEGNDRLFTVGVEGGLFIERDRTFLQSWTCVFDGNRTAFGASGDEVVGTFCVATCRLRQFKPDEKKLLSLIGIELGIAIDMFADRTDVRSNQGTFGILTDDLVTREDSFVAAALNAFVPFFNGKIYSDYSNK